MLNNLHLAAIWRRGDETRLYQIPLLRELQNELADSWQTQLQTFLRDVDEVDFDPGYHPEEHERFRLEHYQLPEWLREETSQTVSNLDTIANHEGELDSIKGIAAFARNKEKQEILLFQNFSRAHVIQPGRFILLRDDTYESTNRPGLTLDGRLAAVFSHTEQKLVFQNFRTTNTFLPLSDVYREASEKDLRDILSHDRLAPEDIEQSISTANQWFRKRIAMLNDSDILNKYSPMEIKRHSEGFEVDLELAHGKIVFPVDKAAAKRLLSFLNEEIFRGAITDTLYETNSRREADS